MINEVAVGEMRDLVRDVGINNSMDFYNFSDLMKAREGMVFPSDHNFTYLLNALFTPLDMTDYENTFVGFNEVGSDLPMDASTNMAWQIEEPWPTRDIDRDLPERKPEPARTTFH